MTDAVTEAELSAVRVNGQISHTSVTTTRQESPRAFILSLSLQETTQEAVKKFWKAIQAFVSGSTPLCGGSRKEVKNREITARPSKTSASGFASQAAASSHQWTDINQEVWKQVPGVSHWHKLIKRRISTVLAEPKHHVAVHTSGVQVDESQPPVLLFLLHFHEDLRRASGQEGRMRGSRLAAFSCNAE